MAKVFNAPENLDIDYKFFGGRFTMKDLGYRCIGLPFAIIFGMIVFMVSSNIILTLIASAPWFIIGFFIGGSKVFDKNERFLKVLLWERKLKARSKTLINRRSVEIADEHIKEGS